MFTRREREGCPQEKEQQSLLRTEHIPGNDLLILTRFSQVRMISPICKTSLD
jgi:hypothetical protein